MEPVLLPIPYVGNTEDNTHCVQACLKMVLSYFEPGQEFTWEELDRASHKEPGMWTWGYAHTVWMADRGYDVVSYGTFDPVQFAANPEAYMLEKFGEEKTRANFEHSNVPLAVEDARACAAHTGITRILKIPNREDIRSLMADGFVVTIGVNSKVLKGEKGYTGHRVVVTGITDTDIYIHNPSTTSVLAHQKVPWDILEKAWGYPDESNKGITAYRLKHT